MTDPLQPELDHARRRAVHYWIQDGLNEITAGALFVLVGLYLALEGITSATSPARPWFALGFPLLVIGLGIAVRRVVLALKDRYVHPRTGYVAFQQKDVRSRWVAGLLAGVLGATFALVAKAPSLVVWIPALLGLVFGLMFFLAWRKVELMRFPVEGLLSALAGLALSFAGLDENLATGLVFVWTGALTATGGALAFRTYLRVAPAREDA